ncbi:MAG TPA: hypothetical protein VMU04_22655 [Candidatus Acidoferrum sp.]|nr:hypothetical protein [Candidatus Acidoferrum sp.]
MLVVGGFCLAGCTSGPRVALTEPVGPAPGATAIGSSRSGQGSLVVYSARVPAVVDLNRDQWLENINPNRADLRFEPAHTGYTIYTKDGRLVATVANARDDEEGTPAVVPLPAGAYRVSAQAIACGGTREYVSLPVVIKPGETTVAHLGGTWVPQGYPADELVTLPCGRPVGWRAASGEFAGLDTGR